MLIYSDSDNLMWFDVTPLTEGAHIVKYQFLVKPCNEVIELFVKFEAVSTVLQLIGADFVIDCENEKTFSVTIRNLNPVDMVINSISHSFPTDNMQILGLTESYLTTPYYLPLGESVLLFFDIIADHNSLITFNFELEYNIVGSTVPRTFPSMYFTLATNFHLSEDEVTFLDFGYICPNTTISKTAKIN